MNFAEICRAVDMSAVVAELGLGGTRGGRTFHCPSHEDKTPSANLLPLKANFPPRWYCHVCNKGGNVLDLVQAVKGLSLRESAEWLVYTLNLPRLLLTDEPSPSVGSPSRPRFKDRYPTLAAMGRTQADFDQGPVGPWEPDEIQALERALKNLHAQPGVPDSLTRLKNRLDSKQRMIETGLDWLLLDEMIAEHGTGREAEQARWRVQITRQRRALIASGKPPAPLRS